MENLNRVLIENNAKQTRKDASHRARLLAVVGELVSDDIAAMKKGRNNG